MLTVPSTGLEMKGASGVSFADGSHDAYAVRKPDVVRDLATASESCGLGAEATDVAVWEPGIATAEPRYLAIATTGPGGGSLELVPAGACAQAGPPVLSVSTRARPSAVALVPINGSTVWALVASHGATSGKGGYQAFKIRIAHAGGEDTLSVLAAFDLDMTYEGWFTDSCPSDIAVGTRIGTAGIEPDKGPDRNCLPGDPRCPL